jgi:CRP-like cAMP-binding protein
MELAEVRLHILNTPLAKSLPEDMQYKFVMLLLWISKTATVEPDQKLFIKGSTDTDKGCLILEGSVRIITEESDQKTIAAPDILGEVQLFTPKGERTATVQAIEGGVILTFGWRDFSSVARKLMSDEEMKTLKKTIADSAWTRENNLMEKILKSYQ